MALDGLGEEKDIFLSPLTLVFPEQFVLPGYIVEVSQTRTGSALFVQYYTRGYLILRTA